MTSNVSYPETDCGLKLREILFSRRRECQVHVRVTFPWRLITESFRPDGLFGYNTIWHVKCMTIIVMSDTLHWVVTRCWVSQYLSEFRKTWCRSPFQVKVFNRFGSCACRFQNFQLSAFEFVGFWHFYQDNRFNKNALSECPWFFWEIGSHVCVNVKRRKAVIISIVCFLDITLFSHFDSKILSTSWMSNTSIIQDVSAFWENHISVLLEVNGRIGLTVILVAKLV